MAIENPKAMKGGLTKQKKMMLAGIASLIYIPKDEFPQVDLPLG